MLRSLGNIANIKRYGHSFSEENKLTIKFSLEIVCLLQPLYV